MASDVGTPPAGATEAAGSFAQVAEDGLFSGMIGALTVAIWFLILDILSGRPLYTPSLLGKVLFQRPDALTDPSIDPAMVVVYTGVHMAVFIAIGMGAAKLISASEKVPAMGILLLFLFVIFEAIFFVYSFAMGGQLVGTLGTWAVVVANILAAGGMAFYFLKRHPMAAASIGKSFEEA